MMKISSSLEKSPNDLYATFPNLVFDDSVGFTCANYKSDYICPICADIKACLRGDPPVSEDCKAVADT